MESWTNLMEALAESVLTASDEEIIEDFKVLGFNSDQCAQNMRLLLLEAILNNNPTD